MKSGLIKKYFIIVGTVFNILLLVVMVLTYLTLDMPLSLGLSKAASVLVKRDESYFHYTGKFLGYFISDEGGVPLGVQEIGVQENKWKLVSAAPEREYFRQEYDDFGRPLISKQGIFLIPPEWKMVVVSNSAELLKAIRNADPGDVITLTAGRYRLSGRSIPVNRPGTRQNPIYLRGPKFGSVIIEMDTLEGFHVRAPFWIFENLDIQGVCSTDGRCEHAFHVVGKGRSFVLRNSRLRDFNASIKVNGIISKGIDFFPDSGLLQNNMFVNSRVRNTGNPVTLLNINSVNNWVVRGNFIADFAKGKGDQVSYAAFMKGNGKNGIFEQNMVVCEDLIPHVNGVRVGLSFGGGGTGAQFCREKNCSIEHSNGIIRNNIVMNCSQDVGIYLNKSDKTLVYNNLLHNTLGIDVRFSSSSANIVNNLISGRVKSRDSGAIIKNNNIIDSDCVGYRRSRCSFDSFFQAPDNGDFRLKSIDNPIFGKGIKVQGLREDLCGQIRPKDEVDIGPIQYSRGFKCLQP